MNYSELIRLQLGGPTPNLFLGFMTSPQAPTHTTYDHKYIVHFPIIVCVCIVQLQLPYVLLYI